MNVKTSADIPSDVNIDSIPHREAYGSIEARRLLGGMSEAAFRRLCYSGELKAKKVGSRVWVKAEEIKAFIDRQPDMAA